MKIDIELVSTHTMKPSSPTPNHLENYKLSFLDQIAPPSLMPLVLFYPSDNHLSNEERSNQLKKSLSEALTVFYPLAGQLIDQTRINCNDQGISYIEARASCKLVDFLKTPNPQELDKFLPGSTDEGKDIGLVVQATFFECGGMAVALAISHKIADGWSLVFFLGSWAAISRGNDSKTLSPKFDGATIFPPVDVAGFDHATGVMKKVEIVTKRFIFSASKITSLRDKYTNDTISGGCQKRPTRFEALSAFIWTRFLIATAARDTHDTTYIFNVPVNLRTRINLPLGDCYFGNFSKTVTIVPSISNLDESYGYRIANQVRDAILNATRDDFDGQKHLRPLKERVEQVKKGKVVTFSCTSLCNFPSYEADFGWGKPVWVGSTSLPFKNLVVFLDTQDGDGIEAWISMKLEDMADLENDEEFHMVASVD